jgi:pyruvate dehydrogenase kinase 2/3/4
MFLLCQHVSVQSVLQGVAELKRELSERAVLTEMPEIHQFLDGFYLSRIGIRILIGETRMIW